MTKLFFVSSFFAGTNLVEFQAELRRAKKLMFLLIKFLTFVKAVVVVVVVDVAVVVGQAWASSDKCFVKRVF